MRRRNFISLVAGAAVFPMPALGQRRPQLIGWLGFGRDANNRVDQTLQEALAQNGLIDGRNINITRRFAKANSAHLAPLAEELSALRPDILVGIGGDVVKALFGASKGGMPVVGGVSDDPVRADLAVSLARPGKNFTGVTFLTDEMAAKRMELLKEAVPGAKHVAVIYNPQHLDDELTFARRGAELLGIELSVHPVSSATEFDKVLQSAVANRADCLFVIASRLTNLHSIKIVQFGIKEKIPVVAAWREFAANGALLSYGPDRILQAKRIAEYVKKILSGAKPGDLPIERPARFELVVNLKTVRALGLTIGREFLLRADDLIE